jgi:hypothetical protein
MDNILTSGQMSKILAKELKRRVSASEIDQYARLLNAPVNRVGNRLGGKTTYLYKESDKERLKQLI